MATRVKLIAVPLPVVPAVADFEILSAILREVLALRADVAVLTSRMPADSPSAQSAVLRAIYEAVASRAFGAAELLVHSALVPELRAAILGAIRVPNARRLGKLLAGIEGYTLDGHVVGRLGSDSTGAIWSVRKG